MSDSYLERFVRRVSCACRYGMKTARLHLPDDCWAGYEATLAAAEAVSATPPAGVFAGPAVSVGLGEGTYADPWNLSDVLAGEYDLDDDVTLWLLPGTYPEAGGTFNVYYITVSDLTVRPLWPTYKIPYPAKIPAGIRIENGQSNVHLRGLYCYNPTVLTGEPLPVGSPWPNYPAAAPAGFDYWSGGGFIELGTTESCSVRYCVVGGGQHGIAAYKSRKLQLEGNVSHGSGWVATDRTHGHAYYLQNDSSVPADRCYMTSCIASTSHRRTPSQLGSVAWHLFATNIDMMNWTVQQSYAKGGTVYQSETMIAKDGQYFENVIQAAAVGTHVSTAPGNAATFGKTSQVDTTLTVNDLLVINGRKVLDNAVWTTASQVSVRNVKTDSRWFATAMDQPPGYASLEAGTFIDLVASPGILSDEYKLHIMPNDVKQAHLYVMDWNDDGQVTFDMATDGFAALGARYTIFHYRAPDVPVRTGTLSLSTNVTLNIVDNELPTIDHDPSDAFIIRLL